MGKIIPILIEDVRFIELLALSSSFPKRGKLRADQVNPNDKNKYKNISNKLITAICGFKNTIPYIIVETNPNKMFTLLPRYKDNASLTILLLISKFE